MCITGNSNKRLSCFTFTINVIRGAIKCIYMIFQMLEIRKNNKLISNENNVHLINC